MNTQKHYSLRSFIPAGVAFVFVLILSFSTFHSIQSQQKRQFLELEELAQRQVAQLSRHMVRLSQLDRQILTEEVGQIATTPYVQSVNAISPDGEIIFSNNRLLLSQDVKQVFSKTLLAKINTAQQTRVAQLHYDHEQKQLHIFMSYVPPDEHQIRTLARGVVYIAYDFSQMNNQLTDQVLHEHLPELFMLILGALSLVWALSKLITQPLFHMAKVADQISHGRFETFKPDSHLSEVFQLQTSLNSMGQQLAQQLKQLRDQANQTQSIIHNMVDGLITINESGIICSYNHAASKIFGYNASEVIGKNINMLMPEPYRTEHDHYLARYQLSRNAKVIGIGREVHGLRKDGNVFPMELAVSELTFNDSVIYIGMVRDITERKQIERMKNEFISTVSHELRTPLTAIIGALGLIKHGATGEISQQTASLVNLADKNSQRLLSLINDLLDMEKIIAGKMSLELSKQHILPVIEQAIDSNQTYSAIREIKLTLSNRGINPQVAIDSRRLIQVMSNLLSNAVKYSPDRGQVEVSLSQNNNCVRVSVIDHGPGIPEIFQKRIFQKFTQADSSDTRTKSGTGLGLAISKEFIERMNGTIGFHSQEGAGACFYFELPIVSD